ncbi:MAG: hypothetical protein WD069_19625 [Planctomycetales bacterium]
MNLEERVRCLEKQNRRFRQVFVGMVVLFGAVSVMGSAPQEKEEGPRVIQAERFEVVDSKGIVKGTFGVEKEVEGSPAIIRAKRFEAADSKGAVKGTFGVDLGRDSFDERRPPELQPDGRTVNLNILSERATLTLWDEFPNGTIRAELSPTGVRFQSPRGDQSAMLRVSKLSPYILLTRNGKPIFTAANFPRPDKMGEDP